ncbi:MAG: potassium channel family protein [Candidatus Nanopelagicales bacterium]
MTEQHLSSPRHVLRAGLPLALAAVGAVFGILALYMWIPEPSSDDPPWLVFAAIVVVTIVYCIAGVWALFRIQKARHPAATGITMLAVMVTAIIAIFALAYLSLSIDNPANFNVPLDKISALYFTMTILTTVGFGDIHAQTHPAMIAVMVQMVLSLTLVTTLAKVLMETSRRVTRKRMATAAEHLPAQAD